MPKTPNLNLELTTDNSITFEEWRKAINGENDGVTVDKSNAQLIDEFLGNFGSITRYSQTPESTVELPGDLNKLYVFIWDDSTIQLAVWTSNYTEGDKFDLEAFSGQPYPSEDVAYLVIKTGGSVGEIIGESISDIVEYEISVGAEDLDSGLYIKNFEDPNMYEDILSNFEAGEMLSQENWGSVYSAVIKDGSSLNMSVTFDSEIVSIIEDGIVASSDYETTLELRYASIMGDGKYIDKPTLSITLDGDLPSEKFLDINPFVDNYGQEESILIGDINETPLFRTSSLTVSLNKAPNPFPLAEKVQDLQRQVGEKKIETVYTTVSGSFIGSRGISDMDAYKLFYDSFEQGPDDDLAEGPAYNYASPGNFISLSSREGALVSVIEGGQLLENRSIIFEEFSIEGDLSYPQYNRIIIIRSNDPHIDEYIIYPPTDLSGGVAEVQTGLREEEEALYYIINKPTGTRTVPIQEQLDSVIQTTVPIPSLPFSVKEIRYIPAGYDIYDPSNYEVGVLYIIVAVGSPMSAGTIEGIFLGNGVKPLMT